MNGRNINKTRELSLNNKASASVSENIFIITENTKANVTPTTYQP